jgi:hypothetical protein
MFRTGAAEADITPPVGLALDGYMARRGLSMGVHDPLLAQVLVLDDDHQRAVIVTLDVLAVSAAFANGLRETLASLLEASSNAVMVCASHTHCGPAGLQTWFGESPALNAQLAQMVTERVTAAARTALQRLTTASITYATGTIEGIGSDRNRRGRAVDSRVSTIRFENSEGTAIAILFHYACHPTVLGADTLLFSADFPGAVRIHIRGTYPETVCLYLNGAAGNISTRFTRRAQSFAEIERLGKLLGQRVISLLEQSTSSPGDLAWDYRKIELPFRTLADILTRSLSVVGVERIDQTRSEGAAIERELRQRMVGRSSQLATLHTLHLGPCKLVFVPGEPFNDLALAVRTVSPNTVIVGYANDYLGYFPTQLAINDQTYEALSSPYDARAHGLIEAVLTTELL